MTNIVLPLIDESEDVLQRTTTQITSENRRRKALNASRRLPRFRAHAHAVSGGPKRASRPEAVVRAQPEFSRGERG